MFNNHTRVLLPESIWEQAQDKEQLKQFILDYMNRYPDYKIIKVKDRFAICEMRR